jgi:hypothetical protein
VKKWTINASNEVRFVIRELFTQSKRSKLSKIKDNWRNEKKKVEEKNNWWVKILDAQITARVQLNASSNSKAEANKFDWLTKSWFVRRRSIADYRESIWWDYLTRFFDLWW